MIHKIYLSVIAVLLLLCGIFYGITVFRGKKINGLTAEKEKITENLARCKNEVATYIKADERAEKTIGEIRTVVKTVKSPCDCYNSALDDTIAGRVRGE